MVGKPKHAQTITQITIDWPGEGKIPIASFLERVKSALETIKASPSPRQREYIDTNIRTIDSAIDFINAAPRQYGVRKMDKIRNDLSAAAITIEANQTLVSEHRALLAGLEKAQREISHLRAGADTLSR